MGWAWDEEDYRDIHDRVMSAGWQDRGEVLLLLFVTGYRGMRLCEVCWKTLEAPTHAGDPGEKCDHKDGLREAIMRTKR